MKVIIQNLVKMFVQRWGGTWESKFSPRSQMILRLLVRGHLEWLLSVHKTVLLNNR